MILALRLSTFPTQEKTNGKSEVIAGLISRCVKCPSLFPNWVDAVGGETP